MNRSFTPAGAIRGLILGAALLALDTLVKESR